VNIIVFAVLGAVLAVALQAGSFEHLWTGVALGALAAWVNQLRGRVGALEANDKKRALAARLAAEQARRDSAEPRPAPPPPTPPVSKPEDAVPPTSVEVPAELRTKPTVSTRPWVRDSVEPARQARSATLEEPEPTHFEAAASLVMRWFTTGNVPVKVGVVLSVIGAAFFIKEGIDRQWFPTLSIELRLMGVALFGIALLVVGWLRRETHKTFALGVQGGGIAILFITIYTSYAVYHVIAAPFAFALLVGVTVAAGVLAVLQDSRTLAVLGIVGGFMAPILTSTDTGNHVALFSYYAILNVAILGMAWFKSWRELNVLGFLFTFGIGSLWGYQGYRPEHFATTEPFLVFFFALYTVIPVLFATRVTVQPRGFVDGSLVFGTPIAAFGLQSQLVGDTEYGLAISALVLAGVYVATATYLHRRRVDELRVLLECELALGIAFLTIAVPLALNASWTSAAWALQGAAMIWLGSRQQRKLALVAGLLLQLLSGAAFTLQAPELDPVPLLNGQWLGAALLALAGWFSAFMLDPDRGGVSADEPGLRHPAVVGVLLVWSTAWWLWAGIAEIERLVPGDLGLAAVLVFSTATTPLALFAARLLAWPRLNALGLVAWLTAALGGVIAVVDLPHPAADLGWLAWPLVIASMYFFLRVCDEQFAALRSALHALAYWATSALLAWELHWQVDRVTDGVWPIAAALAFGATCVLATLRARASIVWPFAKFPALYLRVCSAAVLVAVLLGAVAANVVSPGTPGDLPYVPLLNPLELASVLVVVALLRWLAAARDEDPRIGIEPQHYAIIAALSGWFLATMAVARAVHHWGNVSWDLELLAESTALQAALSIVWGAAGLGGMLFGARTGRRRVWIAGAALMGIVVVKLFLVDLGNTGTLARVVSFLGVGVLLLVVGYFAPVPPRVEPERSTA
jgi:uncharacterized membrane protein